MKLVVAMARNETATPAMAVGHTGKKAQLLLHPCLQGVGEGKELGFSCTYVRAMRKTTTQKVQRRPFASSVSHVTVTDVITGRHTEETQKISLFRKWWAPVGVGCSLFCLVLLR